VNVSRSEKTVARSGSYPFGVIGLVPDTLYGPWMGRHQILSRMAKHLPVVWVNPAKPWRDCWLNGWGADKDFRTGFMRHESELLEFNSGKWLPQVYRPRLIDLLIQRCRLRLMVRHLKALGCEKVVLYITRPALMPDVKLSGVDLVCYHVFDDYSYSETATTIDEKEKCLIENCDIPFFSSEIMMKEKGIYNDASMHLPNGVDLKLFSPSYPVPSDMQSIPHPIVGYSGVIKKQLDLKMIYDLARRRSDWSFVFVGPILNVAGLEDVVAGLKQLKNAYFLGGKPADELPAYIKSFDVGLMFYAQNNYTKYITPLKLNEYMAAGIYVVGTKIAPLEPYDDCIYLAETTDEWNQSIERCLNPGQREMSMRANADRIVQNYDWESMMIRMKDAIGNRLEGKPG
jgi:glycosyltransferase involved in cell wall biosynthesis